MRGDVRWHYLNPRPGPDGRKCKCVAVVSRASPLPLLDGCCPDYGRRARPEKPGRRQQQQQLLQSPLVETTWFHRWLPPCLELPRPDCRLWPAVAGRKTWETPGGETPSSPRVAGRAGRPEHPPLLAASVGSRGPLLSVLLGHQPTTHRLTNKLVRLDKEKGVVKGQEGGFGTSSSPAGGCRTLLVR